MDNEVCNGSGTSLPESDVVDWNRALHRVGGSRDMLREVVEIFRESECPKLVASIHAALAEEQASVLARAAHTLKNNADLFGADPARDAAQTLERLAGQSDFQGASGAWKILEQELEKMCAAMESLGT